MIHDIPAYFAIPRGGAMKRTVMLAAALFVAAGFPVGSAHAQSDFRVTLTRPSQSSFNASFRPTQPVRKRLLH
jgi:hypothetical protein